MGPLSSGGYSVPLCVCLFISVCGRSWCLDDWYWGLPFKALWCNLSHFHSHDGWVPSREPTCVPGLRFIEPHHGKNPLCISIWVCSYQSPLKKMNHGSLITLLHIFHYVAHVKGRVLNISYPVLQWGYIPPESLNVKRGWVLGHRDVHQLVVQELLTQLIMVWGPWYGGSSGNLKNTMWTERGEIKGFQNFIIYSEW